MSKGGWMNLEELEALPWERLPINATWDHVPEEHSGNDAEQCWCTNPKACPEHPKGCPDQVGEFK